MTTAMSLPTHDTVPTRFVEADGIRFAYRRFGNSAGMPLLFVQHFRGNRDNHDSAITDRLARTREVILFDNTGVGQSGGRAPAIAPQPARAALVGTGPRGGEGMAGRPPEVAALWTKTYEPADEMWLPILFYPSASSQAAGRAWLERTRARAADRDDPVSTETATAHRAAASKWGAPAPHSYDYLSGIRQPVLVVNGLQDIIVPTVNSYILQQHIPDAQLILYPDSAHGSHFQFPERFASHLLLFLED